MLTTEITNLFRRYCDEPDESFLSTADVALFCKIGYEEFLSFVDEVTPYVRLRGTNIVVANLRNYDLSQADSVSTPIGSPSILGRNPNITTDGIAWLELPRMKRLISVLRVDPATNQPTEEFQIVNNVSQLTSANTVSWTDETLGFSSEQTGTFTLLYNYEQEIGLATTAAPGGVTADQPAQSWLTPTGTIINMNVNDNLQAWHDIIPLMAYEQYAIVDAAANGQVLSRLAMRKKEFREYLMQRSFSGVQFVNDQNDLSNYSNYIS